MDLVPIKVKIGLRPDKHVDHPNWRVLPMVNSKELVKDKKKEVVRNVPFGWMYDEACGHGDARVGAGDWNSPKGMQWGCLLVTRAFADDALATFPLLVTELTEVEFETFYDNMFNPPGVLHDVGVFQKLEAEYNLRVINGEDVADIKKKIANTLRETSRLTAETWIDFKARKNVAIK
jgi:hypothetical protein